MSNWCKLPYELIADNRLNHTSMIIYAIMLDKSKEGESKITKKKLSGLTGLSIATIKRAIVQLKETGYITDVRVENGRTTFYTLKSVIEIKKKPESDASGLEPIQLESNVPESNSMRTFETDLTLEQVEDLETYLITKLPKSENPKSILKKLYTEMKASASSEVPRHKVKAYLSAMIRNAAPEELKKLESCMDKYKFVINNI